MIFTTVFGFIHASCIVRWAILPDGYPSLVHDMPWVLAGVVSALAIGGKAAVTRAKTSPWEPIEEIAKFTGLARKQEWQGRQPIEASLVI